jgi:hypothetical protein|tara:strand:+ start:672 stop:1058 length:387 start_codon:yes stop_codon:yes gene_type:complete
MIDFSQYSIEELSDLNKALVEHLRVRTQRESQRDMERFELGDRVSFTTDDNRIIEGEIIRFNQKTITVCTDHNHWRVSPKLLTKIITTTVSKPTLKTSTPNKANFLTPGRNSPCPCGSGKKSKRCCFS